jgi:hypothetical protein
MAVISWVTLRGSSVYTMQRQKKPARWQLDLFIVVMIGARLVLMWANVPDSWSSIIDGVWSALTLAGMSGWVWLNHDALREDDQRARRKAHKHPQVPAQPTFSSSPPLTPVQQHFLDMMDTARKTEGVASPRANKRAKQAPGGSHIGYHIRALTVLA